MDKNKERKEKIENPEKSIQYVLPAKDIGKAEIYRGKNVMEML